MTSTPHDQPHIPQLQIDAKTVLAAIVRARARTCAECRQPVTSLIAEISHLLGEITRLHAALIRERLTSANLRAAIRAALGAQADGEPDPLAYLRDEPPEPGGGDAYGACPLPPDGTPGPPCHAQRRAPLPGHDVRPGRILRRHRRGRDRPVAVPA